MSEQKKITIHFILPDYTQFISGGNWYNQQLIIALQKPEKWKIHLLTFEEFQHQYKDIGAGLFIVDTLFLENMREVLKKKKKDQIFYLLVHHLQSLYPPDDHTSREWFDQKERVLLSRYDGIISTSEYTANYLSRHRIMKPITVIPPALSFIPKRIPQREPKPINAILAANVIERKGILPFLKILKEQVIDSSQFSLEIAGDLTMEKDYADECLQLVKTTELQNYCQFIGTISPLDIQDKYRTANLLIATSFFETYGMTLQEGVAWKLPILAIKGGNTANHVQNGLNGYVFDTIKDLVVRLNSLINNQEWMGLLLKQTANTGDKESYNWEDAAEKLVESLGDK